MRLALVALVCACTGVTTLRYKPSPKSSAPAAAIDHGSSTIAIPARGEATSTALADGFPVWVVHHDDGTVSVVGAVAPPPPKRGGGQSVAAQVGRSLVAWIPGVRRFYAGGILFDEHGRALGYADFDACLDTCQQIGDMPQMLRDLDTFAITGTSVGALVPGGPRQRANTFLSWRRPTPGREVDMHEADKPSLPHLSIAAALALADGRYAIVDGETVRSTHAAPVICTPTNKPGTCGACEPDRLPLADIASSDAAHIHREGWWRDPADYRRSKHAIYVESEPGTFLVRRRGATFELVAGIFRGVCGGSW